MNVQPLKLKWKQPYQAQVNHRTISVAQHLRQLRGGHSLAAAHQQMARLYRRTNLGGRHHGPAHGQRTPLRIKGRIVEKKVNQKSTGKTIALSPQISWLKAGSHNYRNRWVRLPGIIT